MMKNVSKEQADRIFRTCDTTGDNRISLEEFRAMLERSDSPAAASSSNKWKIIVVIVGIIAISKIDIGPRNSITFVNTFNNDFLHQESSSPKVALNQLYIDEEEETNKRLHDASAWNPC